MKTASLFFIALVAFFPFFSVFASDTDYAAQWWKVEEAQAKRLPKTALLTIEEILADALITGNQGEILHALLYKTKIVGETDGVDAQIRFLAAQLENTPVKIKPLIAAALANLYQNYYQRNRWTILQRTRTSGGNDTDFPAWDAPRFLAEIDRLYTVALSDTAALQRTPVTDFSSVLVKSEDDFPDTYRPTLFDFLANEAVSFYSLGEQGVPQSEDRFEVSSVSPLFASLEEFLAWKPETTDIHSPKLKVISLLQALLNFHKNDTDVLALSDADFNRISWAKGILDNGDEADVFYEKAMRDFIERWKNCETASNASASLAQFLLTKSHHEIHPLKTNGAGVISGNAARSENALNAYKIATHGISLHPNSPGAKMCRSIIEDLERREIQGLKTEFVWNAPLPDIKFSYKNIKQLHFRAVPAEWTQYLEKNHNRPSSLNTEEFAEVLKTAPAKEWTVSLPETNYALHDYEIPAPAGLAPGFYIIVASVEKNFGKEKNTTGTMPVWVSDLALLFGRDDGAKVAPTDNLQGLVLNAISGEPVANATVTAWLQERTGDRRKVPSVTTNAGGEFSMKLPRPDEKITSDILLLAESDDGQKISNDISSYYYWGNSSDVMPPERRRTHIHFLTDRSIYRPGQTIQFKGIVYSANKETNEYAVLPRKKVTVVIDDPNGKEAGKVELFTNEFGTLSGSFVVPQGRLNGTYALHTVGAENGRGYVSIEEYKRPKFEVKLDAPAVAAKLNDTVVLKGTATAYTGAAIGNAQVKWNVTRIVRWPDWCWWRSSPRARAIAHGTTMTNGTGEFSISFTALPDLSANSEDAPKFDYKVSAEITDGTGETRAENRTVTVGYTALEARIYTDDWQTSDAPVSLRITTSTLDDVFQSASGKIMIYALKQPESVVRAPAGYSIRSSSRTSGELDDPRNWAEGEGVADEKFSTDDDGEATVSVKLPAGIYRAVLTTQDRFGKPVMARREIRVNDTDAKKSNIKTPFNFIEKTQELRPGGEFVALWSSGYDTARALVTIEHRGKILQRFWTDAGATQQKISLPLTEDLRGGFSVKISQVRENRYYSEQKDVYIPWENKELSLAWEHFTSKLTPGGREIWTLKITDNNGTGAISELAAALYDASLDAFNHHGWSDLMHVFYSDAQRWRGNLEFANRITYGEIHFNNLDPKAIYFPPPDYRRWTPIFGRFFYPRSESMISLYAAKGAMETTGFITRSGEGMGMAGGAAFEKESPRKEAFNASDDFTNTTNQSNSSDLDAVVARKNLQETAFFFPSLVSDQNGTVHIAFTVPEALTRWRVLAFAHDKNLRSGAITETAVTAKDLMVQPNPPRFLREGDIVEFTVKITNKSDTVQNGAVRLNFSDALTLDAVDARLGNGTPEKSFAIAAKSSQTVAWRIRIPDGQGFLIYKAVGASGAISDGEEGFLPVLSRKQLVTESAPLPISGAGTKNFRFEKLLASANDTGLRNESLTVQMVSNPAWYAVLALPYLMEFPHDCNEQIFSRYYANALARHIANSDEKIARIFEQWKNTPALDSQLFKNEDLKSVLISETPWLRAAENESVQRRNVGILFDKNRTNAELAGALRRLAERQSPDGRWNWFPGGLDNDFITLHILSGFGKLKNLGVEIDDGATADLSGEIVKRALPRMDAWLTERLEAIKKMAAENGTDYMTENHLSSLVALHLYMRSFFLEMTPVAAKNLEAHDYFIAQAKSHWTNQSRISQGHIALALHRFHDEKTPAEILASLKERAKNDDELGMFWNDTAGWYWWQAPIETQALMIETFSEIANDTDVVNALQTWLLKQKQTQAWQSTKATADAVYALLLRGTNKLASDEIVQVSLAGKTVAPKNIERGTGLYSERLAGDLVKPEMGEISVTKNDTGVAWGSVTWQYFQDIEKITPHEMTPLKIKKTLWKKVRTKSGDELLPVPENAVNVGDTLVARIELRTDRDMEFVHLKDQRGSGTEPVNVLSGYRWNGGLGYYESTGDTASHFFIDALRKGTHVFEYPVRVQLRGVYQSGIAEIQCMYAPEFNSHSESVRLVVE